MESSKQAESQEEEHKRTENKRLKEGTGHSIQVEEGVKIGGDINFQKNPAFIAERKVVFEELIALQN